MAHATQLLEFAAMPTDTQTDEMTLGPRTADQRQEIMLHATGLTAEARKVFRRLLIVSHARGLNAAAIARSAAQARAHFES